MKTIVKGKNIEVPEAVRAYAERKFERLGRILGDGGDVVVELSVEQHRSRDDSRIAEVSLTIEGQALHRRAAAKTHRAAIDTVVDKVERQAVDHREKPRVRARPDEEKQLLRRLADGTAEPGRDRRIVKTKRFGIEPMFEEDAVREMEELGHSFFIFVDAATERLAVLYRRKDGDYGLIEPMVGGEYARGQAEGRSGEKAPRPLARASSTTSERRHA